MQTIKIFLASSAELDADKEQKCGHIVCRHVLFHAMANIMLSGVNFLGIVGNLLKAIELALFYWQRCSEFSFDRDACVVMGSPDPVVETMIRLAGGPKSLTASFNIEAFASQSQAYEQFKENTWGKVLQTFAVMNQSHPFHAIRVQEIRWWALTDQFKNISAKILI